MISAQPAIMQKVSAHRGESRETVELVKFGSERGCRRSHVANALVARGYDQQVKAVELSEAWISLAYATARQVSIILSELGGERGYVCVWLAGCEAGGAAIDFDQEERAFATGAVFQSEPSVGNDLVRRILTVCDEVRGFFPPP